MPKNFGKPSISIFIKNLPYDAFDDDLQQLFGKFGRLRDIYIPKDYHSQEPRGFAYIQFEDVRDAESAIVEADGYEMKGRALEVVFAEGDRKKPVQMRSKASRQFSGQSMSPRRSSPRRQNMSPRRQNMSPRRQNMSPRRQNMSPRRQQMSPRRQHLSPRRRSDLTMRHRSPPMALSRRISHSPERRVRPPVRQHSPIVRRRPSPQRQRIRSPSPQRQRIRSPSPLLRQRDRSPAPRIQERIIRSPRRQPVHRERASLNERRPRTPPPRTPPPPRTHRTRSPLRSHIGRRDGQGTLMSVGIRRAAPEPRVLHNGDRHRSPLLRARPQPREIKQERSPPRKRPIRRSPARHRTDRGLPEEKPSREFASRSRRSPQESRQRPSAVAVQRRSERSHIESRIEVKRPTLIRERKRQLLPRPRTPRTRPSVIVRPERTRPSRRENDQKRDERRRPSSDLRRHSDHEPDEFEFVDEVDDVYEELDVMENIEIELSDIPVFEHDNTSS